MLTLLEDLWILRSYFSGNIHEISLTLLLVFFSISKSPFRFTLKLLSKSKTRVAGLTAVLSSNSFVLLNTSVPRLIFAFMYGLIISMSSDPLCFGMRLIEGLIVTEQIPLPIFISPQDSVIVSSQLNPIIFNSAV